MTYFVLIAMEVKEISMNLHQRHGLIWCKSSRDKWLSKMPKNGFHDPCLHGNHGNHFSPA
jgi:hypothetical protein